LLFFCHSRRESAFALALALLLSFRKESAFALALALLLSFRKESAFALALAFLSVIPAGNLHLHLLLLFFLSFPQGICCCCRTNFALALASKVGPGFSPDIHPIHPTGL
jgi:hypothetical protein